MGEASDFGDRRYAEDDHRDRCVTRHRRCRVVSLPSWDIFEHQPQSYREEVLPSRVEARTAVDLARITTYEAALVATESALNKELMTLSELREVMEYCKDWPGARNAGRVVAFASPYSESAGETLGRIAFDELGVPAPEQQVLIYDRHGLIGRCDYFFERHHTVGEFDGKLKYVGENVEDDPLYKEKQREDRLREAGLEVFRIGWAESRGKKPSVRRKAFAAFERAAGSSRKRTYRFELQPPRD